jgi:hypothetical protein
MGAFANRAGHNTEIFVVPILESLPDFPTGRNLISLKRVILNLVPKRECFWSEPIIFAMRIMTPLRVVPKPHEASWDTSSRATPASFSLGLSVTNALEAKALAS